MNLDLPKTIKFLGKPMNALGWKADINNWDKICEQMRIVYQEFRIFWRFSFS